MRPPLPGLHLDDQFAAALAGRMQPGACEVVALPAGHSAEDALASYQAAARDGPPIYVAPFSGHAPSEWVACLENALGLVPSGATRASQMIEASLGLFGWPRTVVAIMPDLATADMIALCRETAELTRNLDGPVSVVVLCPPDSDLAFERPSWEPLTASVAAPRSPIKEWGRETYLSLRVYWEAAGQPTAIASLDFARGAANTASAETLDARLNDAFDRLAEPLDPDAAGAALTAIPKADLHGLLRTGFLAKAPEDTGCLVGVGLLWQPPGRGHWFLTSRASRWLSAAHAALLASAGAPPTHLRALTRCSPMIGTWVFEMTTCIQRRLQAVCAQEHELVEALLKARGLADDLAVRRSAAPSKLVTAASPRLADYASFGELASLVTHPDLRSLMPLSPRLVNDIRVVRNLAAHLHPVGWPAVLRVLEGLDALL